VAAPIGWGRLSEHAEPDDTGAVRFGLRASVPELRQPGNTLAAQTGTVHSRWSAPGTDRRGLAHEAATMSSAKSQWIRARGSHGMLGLDRSAGKRLEESDVPGDVNAQIEGDRLVQTVVCRG
jgi:hypothetical protein